MLKIQFCSGVENKDEIYSSAQLAARKLVPEEAEQQSARQTTIVKEQRAIDDETTETVLKAEKKHGILIKVKKPEKIASRPVSVTASIFATRKPPAEIPTAIPKEKPVKVSTPLVTTTSKLFAPRTEDMNKGYLMFSDDEPGLTSKFQGDKSNLQIAFCPLID